MPWLDLCKADVSYLTTALVAFQWRSQDFVEGVQSSEGTRVLGAHRLRGAKEVSMALINQCIIKDSYKICAFSDVIGNLLRSQENFGRLQLRLWLPGRTAAPVRGKIPRARLRFVSLR